MMEIKEEHKVQLRKLGLIDEDFKLFDGKFVSYEYDEGKGVRLYDPYYRTSYNEYIDIHGWSSWSTEEDTFMSDILKRSREEAEKREESSQEAKDEKISQELKKRFAKKPHSD